MYILLPIWTNKFLRKSKQKQWQLVCTATPAADWQLNWEGINESLIMPQVLRVVTCYLVPSPLFTFFLIVFASVNMI